MQLLHAYESEWRGRHPGALARAFGLLDFRPGWQEAVATEVQHGRAFCHGLGTGRVQGCSASMGTLAAISWEDRVQLFRYEIVTFNAIVAGGWQAAAFAGRTVRVPSCDLCISLSRYTPKNWLPTPPRRPEWAPAVAQSASLPELAPLHASSKPLPALHLPSGPARYGGSQPGMRAKRALRTHTPPGSTSAMTPRMSEFLPISPNKPGLPAGGGRTNPHIRWV